jgi:uncharacterized protein (TIGR04255 family)
MPKLDFHYPTDIVLKINPLIEAWLTIQWELNQLQDDPLVASDPGFNFPFVLEFYGAVKEKYGNLKELDIKKIPIEITPYQPRYQFQTKGENIWPMLQLGPGIATVNFTEPYSWTYFQEEAVFLRKKLVATYQERNLKTRLISLKYRNAVPCQYTSDHLLDFLGKYLNTSLALPPYIPGLVVTKEKASDLNLHLGFNLNKPKGKGILKIATGTKKVLDASTQTMKDEEHIIFELEVISIGLNAPPLQSLAKFKTWLTDAHNVTHEWFFSLIEGEFLEQYKGEGDSQ